MEFGRGIAQSTLTFYQIESGRGFHGEAQSQDGWRYPTRDLSGMVTWRWKAAAGKNGGQKYGWDATTHNTDTHIFYTPGGLKAAIDDNKGVLHWCEGEPDVWTLHSALVDNPAKAVAATAFMGRGEHLHEVFAKLKSAGVIEVQIWPDCDRPGMRKAYHALRAAKEAGINRVAAYRLPAQITTDSGYDLNDLWKDCQFDSIKFIGALSRAPQIPETELGIYANVAPVQGAPETVDWEKMREEWQSEIIKRLGTPAKRVNGNDYWHCPVHPSRGHGTDDNPSLRITDDRVPGSPWPVCSCEIQNSSDAWEELGAAVGLRYKDFYIDRLPQTPLMKATANGSNDRVPLISSDGEPEKIGKPPIKSFKAALQDYMIELNPDTPVTMQPQLNPITSIHQFGGQAEILVPGQMVAVVGGTGTGKTSFLESLVIEPLMQQGRTLIVDSREWNSLQFAKRAIHRNDGLNASRFLRWQMWKAQQQRGVVPEARVQDAMIGDAVRQRVQDVVSRMSMYPGDAFFIDDPSLGIKALIGMAKQMIMDSHQTASPITDLVLDYIQLITSIDNNEDDNSIVQWLFWIKNALLPDPDSGFPGVITWIVSQVTKSSQVKPKRGQKAMLDLGAATWVTGDAFNLGLTLNLINKRDVATGKYTDEIEDYGLLNVAKNSEGRPGSVEIGIDLPNLRWIDEIVDNSDYEDDDDLDDVD